MYGFTIFLIASGLNLIFGVMNVLNLAHGSLYAFGAYATAFLIGIMAIGYPFQLMYLIPIVGAIATGIIWGPIFERFIRPTLKRPTFVEDQLLLTFGAMLILEDLIRLIWGGAPLTARQPYEMLGSIDILGYLYPLYNIFVIIIGFATAMVFWLFMYKTKIGIIMRATSENREMAKSLGVNVDSLYIKAFIISLILAGFAGGLIVPMKTAILGMGMDALILAFVVVVIGGLGSLKGAFVGSIIVGIIRSWGVAYFPEIELALLYLIAVVVLMWKPTGLFGE
jgi:branched-chain amino acid transport system permease protein